MTAVAALGPVAEAMLEGLYQHRLMSRAQLHDLYTPDHSYQWTSQLLSRLRRAGLVAVVHESGGVRLFYLTAEGIAATESVPRTEPRRKLLTAEQAAGPLRRHTLAVNDVGVSFVKAARQRNEQFGPLSWRHEIAHPIGPPPGRRRPEELIADALLIYQQHDASGAFQMHYGFLELDRATMPDHALAAKLARYARLFNATVASPHGRPSRRFWETRYPVFPAVLLVLDGQPRRRMLQRRSTVLTLCAADPDLQGTPAVEIDACLLEDLRSAGPFAGIWRTPADPASPVDWLGQRISAAPGDSGR